MNHMKVKVLVWGMAAAILFGFMPLFVPATASIFSLTDGNSSVSVDPGSDAGMYEWKVNGNNYLAKQWFWYRIGNSGEELPLNSLTVNSVVPHSANEATMSLTNGAGLTIAIDFLLQGGDPGTGQSGMNEQFRFINTTGSSQTIHFFQYSDFNFCDSDTVKFTPPNYVQQSGGTITFDESAPYYTDELGNQFPKYHQAGVGSTILDLLNTGGPNNLDSTSNGPLTGDANWAFQWDVTVASGGTKTVTTSQNLSAVPEPASLTLLCLGGILGGGLLRWRKRDR
jgi:hypothetical protein